ncbi:hypothetical protein FACS189426_06320 [Bacteroidia bacterium]|nr:hypothetical protein FACS189426_06320 [Bacteroidia bacterium]GHV71210.1 hypothetical protein FACS189420_5450 [Bacteroidia bacterium]
MDNGYNSYDLSRNWFDFCFENTEIVTTTHIALYFFCIEHCNRLGWKDKFGLPTQMAMDAIGVKNWRTYIKAFNDIVDWGFIKVIQKSKNQYSANVIAIVKNTKALTKAITEANAKASTEAAIVKNTEALTKAIQKHSQKQYNGTADINKQLKPNNNLNKENFDFSFVEIEFEKCFFDWIEYKKQRNQSYKSQKSLQACFKKLKELSGCDFETAEKIVEQSMANNWAGLFELKEEKKKVVSNKDKEVNDIWEE